MAAPRLILILGDQLSPHLSSLAEGDPARDRVVMAEVAGECDYVPHHRKKIAFLFAAMRHFADRLRQDGWRVDYYTLDQDHQDLTDALLASRRDSGARQLLVTAPGEWRLLESGMALTVEPGLYVPPGSEQAPARFHGTGIRIEDDIVITEDGCEVLTADVPKDADAIEALMAATGDRRGPA